jgi:hypothetical protein
VKSRPALAALLASALAAAAWPAHADPPPARLSETGLYEAGSTSAIRAGNVAYSPQYPLWSDGAAKRRWLYLPPGTSIDAARPDEWDFPPGTRLWKEFEHDGRPVETRLIERLADGRWRFAAYVWDASGRDAVLAPSAGVRALPVAAAPGGRYMVPGEADCRACHEGAAVPVLGVGALQLSPARDPLAPHAEARAAGDVDLDALVARGWLRNLPPRMLQEPPRIAAPSPEGRAALGYLHGNCGHCHNDTAAAPPVGLVLAQKAGAGRAGYEAAIASLAGVPARYRTVIERMRTRNPRVQMPPLGTQSPDTQALALIERWMRNRSNNPKELHP